MREQATIRGRTALMAATLVGAGLLLAGCGSTSLLTMPGGLTTASMATPTAAPPVATAPAAPAPTAAAKAATKTAVAVGPAPQKTAPQKTAPPNSATPQPPPAPAPADASATSTTSIVETAAAAGSAALAALLPVGNTPSVDVPSVDLYSRVARGALNCWFGSGPLRQTHLFYADLAPASKGGVGEIFVHERDTSGQASPRGTRALRITLSPETDARTKLDMQAGRIPADLAQAMEKDVIAWAHDKPSCEVRVVRPPPPPPVVETKAKTGAKKQVAVAKR